MHRKYSRQRRRSSKKRNKTKRKSKRMRGGVTVTGFRGTGVGPFLAASTTLHIELPARGAH